MGGPVKCDVVLAGVGGQGVLTVAAIISASAQRLRLQVKQAEVHGMSQRGGSVLATTRISDRPVASPLVCDGRADLLIGLEPLEALRYLPLLSRDGALVSTSEPVVNIPDYPDLESVAARIESVPGSLLIDATEIARGLKSPRSVNVILVGAAARHLPLDDQTIEATIRWFFRAKDQRTQDVNVEAYRAGKAAAAC